MTFDMVQMASDLGNHDDIRRLAPGMLAAAGCMERRRVLCTTALAGS